MLYRERGGIQGGTIREVSILQGSKDTRGSITNLPCEYVTSRIDLKIARCPTVNRTAGGKDVPSGRSAISLPPRR